METSINGPVSQQELVRLANKLREELINYEGKFGSSREFAEIMDSAGALIVAILEPEEFRVSASQPKRSYRFLRNLHAAPRQVVTPRTQVSRAGRPRMKRFILTGAPGAGKTAILRLLELEGFGVVEEAATDVIALWQAQGIAQPWTDRRSLRRSPACKDKGRFDQHPRP